MNAEKKAREAIAGIITTMIDDMELDQYDDRDYIIQEINQALSDAVDEVKQAWESGRSIRVNR